MTLYLVAHLVRGAPAFDIARRCDDMGTADDPGPWWIVPTSGHRAYPYWSARLMDVVALENFPEAEFPPHDDWPDHYSCNDHPITYEAEDILAIIGRKPVQPAIRRRV